MCSVATAETSPPMPQVDCFKIVFDVTMWQGHQCCWRWDVATAEIPPPVLQVDCFIIVFDTLKGHHQRNTPPLAQVDFLFFYAVLNGVKTPPINTFTNATS